MSGTNYNRSSTSSGRVSPDLQPLSTTGRFNNPSNPYSRPSSSASSVQTPTFPNTNNNSTSTSSTNMAIGRSISPIMGRRARQLQADEGLLPSIQYRSSDARDSGVRRENLVSFNGEGNAFSARLDTSDDPPVADSRSSQSGRARAGTLPSSWGQSGADVRATDSRTLAISAIGDIGSRPRSSQLANRWQNQIESVPGTPPSDTVNPSGYATSNGVQNSALHPSQRNVSGGTRPMTLFRQFSAASELGRSTPSPSLQMNALNPKGQSMFDTNNSNFTTQPNVSDLRNRSSSMTTPLSGLNSTPFGPSIFTSSWGETGMGSSTGTESNTSRRSSTLASMSATSLGQDGKGSFSYDFVQDSQPTSYEAVQLDGSHDVHTLDYLGLEQEDVNLQSNQIGTSSSSGDSRNLLNVNFLGPSRNRASTLASMPPGPGGRNRNEMNSISGGLVGSTSSAAASSSTEADNRLQDLYNAYTQQNLSTGSGIGNLGANAAQGRNRAGTVAALGGPGGRQRLERELLRMATSGNLSNLSSNEVNTLLASLEGLGLGGAPEGVSNLYSNAPLEGFPRLDVSTPPPLSGRPSPSFNTMPSTPTGQSNRKISPFDENINSYTLPYNVAVSEPHSANISTTNLRQTYPNSNGQSTAVQRETTPNGPNTNQTPSRSLWIGNLNSATTGQELMHAFAPYGAIESLRLLPEKECGFVNFVELSDAVRAREDVLGRLNAKLEKLGIGQGGTVRIGFGKIDALPSHTGVFGSGGGVGVGSNTNPVSSSNVGNNRSNMNNAMSSDLTPQQQQQIYDDLMGPNAGINGSATASGLTGAAMAADMNVPTRALWVGSIASNVTPATLLSIFTPFGPVESARVLTHKNCGFVNFERVDDAVRARKMLNGREVLGSEMGAMRIGFAKVPSRNIEQLPSNESELEFGEALQNLSDLKGAKYANMPVEEQMNSGGMENYRSNLVVDLLNQKQQKVGHNSSDSADKQSFDANTINQTVPSRPQVTRTDSSNNVNVNIRPPGTSASSSIVPASDKGGVPLPAHMMPQPSVSDLQLLMRELSRDDLEADIEGDVASVSDLRPMMTYYMTIPLVSEVSSGRRYETTKLRETRRGIESGQYSTAQCDQLASEYIDSIVDLASDYIGNTLVQKFFETCSDPMKMQLLHRLSPHLAMVGCHKNGTWAAQKILDCTNSVEQVQLIGQNLRPYIPGLLLDPFGNYVVQCCLKWARFNDFVFDAMVDRCWEIAQGRFGARSMRACLENENVSKRQRKRVAIAVILNSVPLATSPNGSILLTWLLESPELSKSYRLLAPRFTPHLTHLCTHKLASGTVLRLATQKTELEASKMILDALFESEGHSIILEEIIVDQVHGSQFITKILASPTLTNEQREEYNEQVKVLLQKHQLNGVPAYRRLCEDLGLRPISTVTTNVQNPVAWGVPAVSQDVSMKSSGQQQMPKSFMPLTNNTTLNGSAQTGFNNGMTGANGGYIGGGSVNLPFNSVEMHGPNQSEMGFNGIQQGMVGGQQQQGGGPFTSLHGQQFAKPIHQTQNTNSQHDPAFNPFWNSGQGSFSPPGSNDQSWMPGQSPTMRRNY